MHTFKRIQNKRLSIFAKKLKYFVILQNLPYFSTKSSLRRYLRDFGTVKKVSLLHKADGTYTRTARVKMESQDSCEKIIKQKDHIVDGKRIQVNNYLGMHKLKRTFVVGTYEVTLKNLFSPGLPVPENEDNNELLAVEAYRSLENAFHQFNYTKILIIHGKNRFYNGNARVTFIDDIKEDQIMLLVNERFGHRIVNSRKYKSSVSGATNAVATIETSADVA